MSKTQPPTNPQDAMLVIFDKFAKAKKTSESLQRAQQSHNRAEYQIRDAVREYNLALAEQIIEALIAEGLGICERSFASRNHIAPEAGMMGIVTSGTRSRGGSYYEHDEHYVDTKLKCKACRANITVRTGHDSLIELDARAYWTKQLRKNFEQPYSLYYIEELLAWAAEHGVEAQPITNQGNTYYLAGNALKYHPYHG